jgi:hypothetical protein
MNETVENLILVQLPEMRGEMAAMRADVIAMKDGFTDVRGRVDGIATLLTLLAGHVHSIDERVEKLVEARG